VAVVLWAVLSIASAGPVAAEKGADRRALGPEVALSSAVAAQGQYDMHDRFMLRFEFDNDILLSSDDAFTAGWSLQLHSPMLDSWAGPLLRWIGRLPGLGDDGTGGRLVRWSTGLSQAISTPKDVTIAEPQPGDVPWAGTLGFHGTVSSYDNRRLSATQVYLGCTGPCSHAEDVQRFVHEDLGMGDPPAGWSNQLESKVLGNLNLASSHKLWAPPESAYGAGRWTTDLAIGGQLGLGNLATYARLHLEYRFGYGMPMGFTHVPDPPGIGVVLDPVYEPGDMSADESTCWRAYVSFVARASYYADHLFADGGLTESGGYHPGLDPNVGQSELIVGLHVRRAPWAVHLSYYRFFLGPEDVGLSSNLDWMNLSLEVQF
jgi:hypothetical protein